MNRTPRSIVRQITSGGCSRFSTIEAAITAPSGKVQIVVRPVAGSVSVDVRGANVSLLSWIVTTGMEWRAWEPRLVEKLKTNLIMDIYLWRRRTYNYTVPGTR